MDVLSKNTLNANHFLFKFLIIGLTAIYSCQQQKQGEEKIQVGEITSPTDSMSSLPYLVVGNDDNLYLSWVETHQDTAKLLSAQWTDKSWSKPEKITQGTDWFVNWADYPMISVGSSGKQLAHFLAKNAEGTYSYDVNLIIKSNVSESWGKPFVPHQDNTPTEHGFVSMIPLGDNTFQVAWLDGRNTGGDHGEHHGAMTLRAGVVDENGTVTEELQLDDRVCDCCQTSGAMTKNGPVIVYRDRSALEIRDMAIVRKVNGKWTEPKTIYADNWKIAGCPVNGPRVAARKNTLALAWYSASKNLPEVKVTFSTDGGETFQPPIIVDDKQPLGRVDIVLVDNKRAMVSWLSQNEDSTYIKARLVHINGSMQAPLIISETSSSRSSGFPQMEIYNNEVFFAWTDQGDQKIHLAKAKLNL